MNTEYQRIVAKRNRLMSKLAAVGPFIQGSLVETARICGSPGCACRQGGPKHPVLFVTYAVKGKTVSLYVPRDREDEVREWAANFKQLKQLMREISDLGKELVRFREP
jgi:hypothetical protein